MSTSTRAISDRSQEVLDAFTVAGAVLAAVACLVRGPFLTEWPDLDPARRLGVDGAAAGGRRGGRTAAVQRIAISDRARSRPEMLADPVGCFQTVYAAYTLERVGYEWLSTLLAALVGIEPYEIRQVLEEGKRWPRPAVSDVGLRLLAVWGRTRTGRPLIVVLRPTGKAMDWLIVGAVDMTPDQLAAFEGWEAGHER